MKFYISISSIESKTLIALLYVIYLYKYEQFIYKYILDIIFNDIIYFSIRKISHLSHIYLTCDSHPFPHNKLIAEFWQAKAMKSSLLTCKDPSVPLLQSWDNSSPNKKIIQNTRPRRYNRAECWSQPSDSGSFLYDPCRATRSQPT